MKKRRGRFLKLYMVCLRIYRVDLGYVTVKVICRNYMLRLYVENR